MSKTRTPRAESAKRSTSFGEREQDRFRALVDDLRRTGYSHGEVAKMLGVRPDHLTRVVKGERRVSAKAMLGAAHSLGMDYKYFSSDEEKHWRDWLSTNHQLAATAPISPAPISPAESRVDLAELTDRVFRMAAERNDEAVATSTFGLAQAVMGLPAVQLAKHIVDWARTPPIKNFDDPDLARLGPPLASAVRDLLLPAKAPRPKNA